MSKSLLIKAIALTAVVALSSCGGPAVKADNTSSTGNNNDTTNTDLDIEEVKMDPLVLPVVDEAAEAKMKAEQKAKMLMDAIADNMTVYFKFDQSAVTAEARDSLDLHAEYLNLNMDQQVVLEGHADERGTPEYNLGLSERRANAVAAYLRLQGVNKAQISIIAMGEESPADFGQTNAAHAKNRRVEVIYQ
ncbi:MAG: peptidoglycan-associated lipoprotein Pal [Saccharospirillaceae bacterium]|nr:peptidoglycan-associated lipoprotein Pal [Pseudomonadales bacterium]NRB78543.1 peptidoglycan-associated lipoprotein Pal [Saccharospirillaceae bacterium]